MMKSLNAPQRIWEWFSQITLNTTFPDAILALLISLVAALLVYLIGRNWDRLRNFKEKRLFRKLFGADSREAFFIVLDIYRDTRLLLPPEQSSLGISHTWDPKDIDKRFYKIFSDHHTIIPGAFEDLLGFCSARASGYLSEAFGKFITGGAKTTSDEKVKDRWAGTFISIGSSYSNIFSDRVKKLPQNAWLKDDRGTFTLANGEIIEIEGNLDKGVILRIRNSRFPNYTFVVCAGLGEWGTSGAAWYLAHNWIRVAKKFGKRDFAIFAVEGQSDESAYIVKEFSTPSLWQKTRSSILQTIQSWF